MFVLEPSATPVASTWGIVAIVLALGAVAWRAFRRQLNRGGAVLLAVIAIGTAAAAVWAATIVMDGAVGDWSGVPLGTDITDDSSNDDPAEDIVALFMTKDATNVYARIEREKHRRGVQ